MPTRQERRDYTPEQESAHAIGESCDVDECLHCAALDCTHDERDHGICLDCGHEEDPGEAIDRAQDGLEDR